MIVKHLKLIVAALLVVGAGAAVAQVADPGLMNAQDVVMARKMVMRTFGAQAGILRAATQSGDLEAAKTAATTIAALAGALPPLFSREHANAYPVSGSKWRFSGGDLADLTQKISALQAAASAAAAASSVSAIDPRSILGTCGACHGTFRAEL